jgi:hypothetical protein
MSEEQTVRFNAALPPPYSANWRIAERGSNEDAPRRAGYQAPGKEPVTFILEEFHFRGGQSVDTAEYPFNGLWSNTRLNESPQVLRIRGHIRGADYIKARNDFIEHLRIVTDDDTPGYIDLPFWGRFPVVVVNYDITEKADEKGQCGVTLDFTRAGVSAESRNIEAGAGAEAGAAADAARAAAQADFQNKLEGSTDVNTLSAGFGKIKAALASIVGRVRATGTALNAITAEINGISDLIAQGIRAPGELASAVFNALFSIAAGLIEIKNAAASYDSGGVSGGTGKNDFEAAYYPAPEENNEKNVLLLLFSASEYTLDVPAATTAQQNTKQAIENLYRAGALCAAGLVITQTDTPYQKAQNYWNLFIKLEESVERDNPAVYTAMENLRTAVSGELSRKDLDKELYTVFNVPLPLLYIARYLGCDEAKLRELNTIADSFSVKGGVVYV